MIVFVLYFSIGQLISTNNSDFPPEFPFVQVDEIQLSDEGDGRIGQSFRLAFFKNGDIVAVNLPQSNFYQQYDKNGRFIRKVTMDDCFPGFNSGLSGHPYVNDENLLVISTTVFPTGILFNEDGKCVEFYENREIFSIHTGIVVYEDYIIGTYGNISMRPDDPTYRIEVFDRKTQSRIKSFYYERELSNATMFIDTYSRFLQIGSKLYLSQVVRPEIQVFDLANDFAHSVLNPEPGFWNPFEKDFEYGNTNNGLRGVFQTRREYFHNKALNRGVLYHQGKLIVQYTLENMGEFEGKRLHNGIIIMDKRGRRLHENEIIFENPDRRYTTFQYFSAACENYLYSVYAADENSDNINPILKRYKLDLEAL